MDRETMRPINEERLSKCKVTRGDVVTACDLIRKGKRRYEKIEELTGVPWYLVGCLHYRESTCDFNTHLHNGDSLKYRTRRIPSGRPLHGTPPFTFEESAVDALRMRGFDKVRDGDFLEMCYLFEAYNGWGYMTGAGRKTTPSKTSPYLWSGTNLYSKGKYVADGVFDEGVVDQQVGCMAIICELVGGFGEMEEELTLHSDGISYKGEVLECKMETYGDVFQAMATAAAKFGLTMDTPMAMSFKSVKETEKPVEEKPVLQKGDVGGHVTTLQERLNAALRERNMTELDLDGDFGGLTEDAVIWFQRNHNDGLEVDGVVGPMTWKALERPADLREGGFDSEAFMQLMEGECRQDISWRGNGRAKKYTDVYKHLFGSGRYSWCAAFQTWCLLNIGVNVYTGLMDFGGEKWSLALVEAWERFAKHKGWYHKGTSGMRRGDIVLFNWDGDSWEDHIGAYTGRRENGYFVCAEGNTSDRTDFKERTSSLISGYVRIPEGTQEVKW